MPDLTRLGSHLSRQADACARLGSPMYAALIRRLLDHLGEDGPVRRALEPYADAPGPDATGLRLLGSVHRLVLQQRAADLARHYPSVGGRFVLDRAWPAFVAALDEHADEIAARLSRPPQTNEVGRAAGLVGALLRLTAARAAPVRLHELGASAGLNLRADHFRYVGAHGAVGPAESPVLLDPAWRGASTPTDAPLRVVEREGCDPDPLDPGDPEDRLTLTAYVWPDQPERLDRLRGAFAVAAGVPATVRCERAIDLVRRLDVRPGAWTVLWHSVMWQYLDAEERAQVATEIARLGESATADAPFAHVSLEPRRRDPAAPHAFLVVTEAWPGGRPGGRSGGRSGAGPEILGEAPGHGVPVVWER